MDAQILRILLLSTKNHSAIRFRKSVVPGLRRKMPNPTTASCYGCHGEHTAVENTFVQFYPTLFEVAQKFGTVKPTYDPKRTVR